MVHGEIALIWVLSILSNHGIEASDRLKGKE
jgi:hypothetical protein